MLTSYAAICILAHCTPLPQAAKLHLVTPALARIHTSFSKHFFVFFCQYVADREMDIQDQHCGLLGNCTINNKLLRQCEMNKKKQS